MNAKDLYAAGRLKEAIAAMNDEVRQKPTDTAKRGFLCELLCFAGELERIDKQLDTIGDQDPQAMLGVALFRQLVRAEQARQQLYSEGRVPEFIDEPTEALKLCLQASIASREGNNAEAAKLLAEAEEKRPKAKGTCDGKPFDDLRDLDDLNAPFMEVLTSNGKYYWVPLERIELMEFRPPKRPRDLLWRAAHMVVAGGPDGEVYIPTLYAGSQQNADDMVRLGRATDWQGGDGSPVRGIGLRTFLVGSEDRTVMEINEFSVNV